MPEEEPALPPDPALLNRQPKWFKPAFHFAIAASIVFAIAVVIAPMTLRARKKADQTQAVNNLRQIGFALSEFESDYGAYPSKTTAARLIADDPSIGLDLTKSSSNALFRQLIAAGYTQFEQMFYAKVAGCRRPDGDISPRQALKKGEVGFAYVAGLDSKRDPRTPIAFAPIIPGTTRFDPKGFDKGGRAAVLLLDNSVISYPIHEDGHIYDKGIDLLSPKHLLWKGKAPDIRYPEL